MAAGSNDVAQTGVATALAGSVVDDGALGPLVISWSQLSGPGTATFDDDNDPATNVSFDTAGTYVLELRANDSEYDLADTVAFEVGDPLPGSPPGLRPASRPGSAAAPRCHDARHAHHGRHRWHPAGGGGAHGRGRRQPRVHDKFGDACQCAEATDDGAVLDPDDFDEIRDYLSGRITGPAADVIEARCSVAGTTECNLRDLVFLKQALDLGPGVGSVEVRCDAALSPAPGP